MEKNAVTNISFRIVQMLNFVELRGKWSLQKPCRSWGLVIKNLRSKINGLGWLLAPLVHTLYYGHPVRGLDPPSPLRRPFCIQRRGGRRGAGKTKAATCIRDRASGNRIKPFCPLFISRHFKSFLDSNNNFSLALTKYTRQKGSHHDPFGNFNSLWHFPNMAIFAGSFSHVFSATKTFAF